MATQALPIINISAIYLQHQPPNTKKHETKIQILRFMTATFLLAILLGFSACKKDIPFNPKDKTLNLESGMPQNTFDMATGYLL
ncbi:MAG TPA: hypothetical protein ENN49_05015 [Bacteroidales bacterium]|nr:hypothetical protein [Bacteroidales bacterium]